MRHAIIAGSALALLPLLALGACCGSPARTTCGDCRLRLDRVSIANWDAHDRAHVVLSALPGHRPLVDEHLEAGERMDRIPVGETDVRGIAYEVTFVHGGRLVGHHTCGGPGSTVFEAALDVESSACSNVRSTLTVSEPSGHTYLRRQRHHLGSEPVPCE